MGEVFRVKGQKLKKIYDAIRIINTYALVFFILLLLQKHTIGLFINFEGIDIVFCVSSLILIKLFIRADVPKDDEEHFFILKRIKNSHN